MAPSRVRSRMASIPVFHDRLPALAFDHQAHAGNVLDRGDRPFESHGGGIVRREGGADSGRAADRALSGTVSPDRRYRGQNPNLWQHYVVARIPRTYS